MLDCFNEELDGFYEKYNNYYKQYQVNSFKEIGMQRLGKILKKTVRIFRSGVINDIKCSILQRSIVQPKHI